MSSSAMKLTRPSLCTLLTVVDGKDRGANVAEIEGHAGDRPPRIYGRIVYPGEVGVAVALELQGLSPHHVPWEILKYMGGTGVSRNSSKSVRVLSVEDTMHVAAGVALLIRFPRETRNTLRSAQGDRTKAS